MKKLFALRGAVQVLNEENDILKQIAALYDTILLENKLDEADIVSLIFSVTKDISAKNPAQALRQSGRALQTALFSAVEPDIAPAHPRMIRVLAHCYMENDAAPHHIYINGAEILRPDWALKDGRAAALP